MYLVLSMFIVVQIVSECEQIKVQIATNFNKIK